MDTQVDLFGEVIPPKRVVVNRPHAERKPVAKLVIDRKALWSNSGYLGGIKEVDDDEDITEVKSTSDTRSDNSTIEKLERVLGLSPVIKDNQWVRSHGAFEYRLVGKPFTGPKRFGEPLSMERFCQQMLILNSARTSIEPLFRDPCSWLVLNSMGVLATRLRMMRPDEDPFACLAAFLEVLTQQDFIDNSRMGETIRNLTKRDETRRKRAAAREEMSKRAANPATELDNDSEDDE